jgi:hypothetical protein
MQKKQIKSDYGYMILTVLLVPIERLEQAAHGVSPKPKKRPIWLDGSAQRLHPLTTRYCCKKVPIFKKLYITFTYRSAERTSHYEFANPPSPWHSSGIGLVKQPEWRLDKHIYRQTTHKSPLEVRLIRRVLLGSAAQLCHMIIVENVIIRW